MPMRTRVLCHPSALLLLLATLGITVRAHAGAPAFRGAGELTSARVTQPYLQRALTHGAAWKNFQARHGNWSALWNEATATPHRAVGPSIPLRGFANDAASADRAVRGFIAANPSLFGGSGIALETVASYRHGGVWYVRYRQLVQGVPVLFSDVEVRV